MRGGRRLPAMVIMIGLLTGCSDPAGAVRRERADAARKASPSPSSTAAAKKPHTPVWWQAPGKVRVANGLRVHTGALHAGRMKVAIRDVGAHAGRTVVASGRPHGAAIGGFTLTGIKIAKDATTGAYGVTFHYRRR